MDQTPLSGSSRIRSTQSTRATSVSAGSRRSSACDKGFQQHLIDYKIYPEGYESGNGLPSSEPSNLDHIQEALSADRASLSPSQFTQSTFRDFKNKNKRVIFESDVMSAVIPVICGNSSIDSQQNVLFTELDPITSTDAVKPKPDLFDGASLVNIHEDVRNNPILKSKVIPTKHPNIPMAPNFFMEVKGPNGNASVAQRQACYDGAYGVRAMHALKNHGKTEEQYDGDAYTYSSTYHPATGTLQLYAHHATAPVDAGGRPEYHMTQIDTWGMTGNINSFRRGATALRNARDLARQQRDNLIQAANACHVRPEVQKNDAGWRDAHDDLQGQISDAYDDNSGEDPETYNTLQFHRRTTGLRTLAKNRLHWGQTTLI
ncbi:hypothetical protein MAC_06015 [Metarhizium acridum CQMa 102]|uniref:DUF7924 domain-containing protein n=2 Tax=Metarhizium acridum TaxID=92637 RepID=E9E817_METAQ|nr:uncharacterized protein MAC_06015 [Metarhizium acridum CQMa 102]EFY87888.1 hypothetical protein MAC_06015 [Metarhizium acridum CQMa 102]